VKRGKGGIGTQIPTVIKTSGNYWGYKRRTGAGQYMEKLASHPSELLLRQKKVLAYKALPALVLKKGDFTEYFYPPFHTMADN